MSSNWLDLAAPTGTGLLRKLDKIFMVLSAELSFQSHFYKLDLIIYPPIVISNCTARLNVCFKLSIAFGPG